MKSFIISNLSIFTLIIYSRLTNIFRAKQQTWISCTFFYYGKLNNRKSWCQIGAVFPLKWRRFCFSNWSLILRNHIWVWTPRLLFKGITIQRMLWNTVVHILLRTHWILIARDIRHQRSRIRVYAKRKSKREILWLLDDLQDLKSIELSLVL